MVGDGLNDAGALAQSDVGVAVSENINVFSPACDAILDNNLKKIGELMYKSHDGLQFEYQVSCKELDFLVDATMQHEEVLGSRIMGKGHGGCTISLIESSMSDQIVDEICENYLLQFGIKPEVYPVKLTSGASESDI